jgi:hypothetical protein
LDPKMFSGYIRGKFPKLPNPVNSLQKELLLSAVLAIMLEVFHF